MKILIDKPIRKSNPVGWIKVAFMPMSFVTGIEYKPLSGTHTRYRGSEAEVITKKGWLIWLHLPFLSIQIMGMKGDDTSYGEDL